MIKIEHWGSQAQKDSFPHKKQQLPKEYRNKESYNFLREGGHLSVIGSRQFFVARPLPLASTAGLYKMLVPPLPHPQLELKTLSLL